ncbi:MAG: riboflavin synthase [Bacteroidia bacterium]
MFTGIIEALGIVESVHNEGSNRIFGIAAPFAEGVRIDQSIAHDGACLTVTAVLSQAGGVVRYTVAAVEETLRKTQLGDWQPGRRINLERSLRVGDRLDGHFVQGHVDSVGVVQQIDDRDGSWNIHFAYDPQHAALLVPKGSICVNGVSLTLVAADRDHFSVTIIPYTYTHTNFADLVAGQRVNLEFDILGKYILRSEAMKTSA